MSSRRIVGVLVVTIALLQPIAAAAQGAGSAGVAGVVKDASGAVLPGVVVEAASPALIEKVRSTMTDEQGQYQITDLRPGVYTITFTLTGFATVVRDRLEMTTGFTSTVNAEMKIGTLEESITVSGESPIVDVRNVNTQAVLARETLDALPSARTIGSYATLIPGAQVTGQDVGGTAGNAGAGGGWSIHGNRAGDITYYEDGMNRNSLLGGGNTTFSFNHSATQEVQVQTGGMSAESAQGGVVINVVPREGGNKFSGYASVNGTSGRLQGSNLTDELRAKGLTGSPSVRRLYDAGFSLGGPIKADKLWFFTAHRWWGAGQYKPNSYYNATQDSFVYTPDLSRPAFTDANFGDNAVRATWQLSERNKFNFAFNHQRNCDCVYQLLERNAAPEALAQHHYNPNWNASVTWSSPTTNKLLLQATFGFTNGGMKNKLMPQTTRDQIAITELSTNFQYRNRAISFSPTGSYGIRDTTLLNTRFTGSYVTGAHNFKSGVTLQLGKKDFTDVFIPGGMDFSVRNGMPVQVRYWAQPFEEHERIRNLGLFVQDQWTLQQRLTLNLGIRYEHLVGWTPPQSIPAGPLVPERVFDRVDNIPNLKDLLPRVGASFDPFGNARTAVKAFIGKYLPVESLNGFATLANPVNRMVTSATRNWTDLNRNFVPCDIEGECGPLSSNLFGQLGLGTSYADDVLEGFGNRHYNWQTSVSVQHEIRSGISLEAGYFRTWYGNFNVTDNELVAPADFDPYCITVPSDPALPNAGGQQCGLYDLNPTKFGQTRNSVQQASKYGDKQELFNGVDLLVKARFAEGGMLQGGVSSGSTLLDDCLVVDSPQQSLDGFCRVSSPWANGTQVRFFAVYPMWWDIQASMTYQNLPGIPVSASYVVGNAEVIGLGRPLSGGANATRTIELIPGVSPASTQFLDRRQQVDVRFSKIFRIGPVEFKGDVDIYNLLNEGYVLQHNTRYGPTWLAPQQVLQARLLKLGIQLEF